MHKTKSSVTSFVVILPPPVASNHYMSKPSTDELSPKSLTRLFVTVHIHTQKSIFTKFATLQYNSYLLLNHNTVWQENFPASVHHIMAPSILGPQDVTTNGIRVFHPLTFISYNSHWSLNNLYKTPMPPLRRIRFLLGRMHLYRCIESVAWFLSNWVIFVWYMLPMYGCVCMLLQT